MKKSIKYNPKIYTLSALIVGYLLIGDYTAYQQNAFGNWLMTVGQILECNSSIQQAIEELIQEKTYNIHSKKYKQTGNPFMDNLPLVDIIDENKEEIEEIKNMLNNMINKIDNIKK